MSVVLVQPLSRQEATVSALDGPWFSRLVTAGARWVCSHRDHLNRINVFPVVDGDTGTNMAATLRSVARALAAAGGSLPEAARAAADGCLMGARGNSGMILCHVFSSLADGVADRSVIHPAELAEILRRASQNLYQALEKPVEGTILTVLRESTADPELERARDIPELFAILLAAAQASLARTPEKLEALRRAKVVDAGAMGYVLLVEGMVREMSGLPLPTLEEEVVAAPRHSTVKREEHPKFRYCTEVIAETREPTTPSRLKLLFRAQGDSFIPLVSGRRIKIHIHTNAPQEVFRLAEQLGKVLKTKVEDMRNQSHSMFSDGAASAATGLRTHVVTDSTCDVPPEVLAQWGVSFVPLKVAFGDEVLRDQIDILPDEFLHRLTTSAVHPKTSQPSPDDFSRVFRQLEAACTDGQEILLMVLSSALSGTYSSGKLAGSRHDKRRVHVYDASFASAPFGLLVQRAAELARQGLSAADIIARLDETKGRTNILFVLDTLEYLRRGGRIGRATAFIGGLLDLKPILSFEDGKLAPKARARGRDRARSALLEMLEAEVPRDRPVRFMLVHSGRPDLLAPVESYLSERFQTSQILSCTAGAVISSHAGPNAWGVAWMVE